MNRLLLLFVTGTTLGLFAAEEPSELSPQQLSAPYIHPGVIVQKDNVWKGYDNMLHLGNALSLSVSIVSPEGLTFPVGESIIYNKVAATLSGAGITTQRAKGLEKPNLPMFNLLILVYPLSDGFSAFVEGRLMEEVSLERLPLSKEAFYQAITWEQKNLIVSNARQFDGMLLQTVEQIAKSFADRYAFFAAHEQPEELKPSIRGQDKTPDTTSNNKKINKPIVPFENNPPGDKLKLR